MRFRNAAFLLLITIGAPCFQGNSSAGWVVVGLVGKWHVVDTAQPVSFGMALPPGKRFLRDDPQARSGSITLVWNEKERVTHACEKAGDCASPFTVPATAPGTASQSSLFASVLQAFSHDPKRYLAAVSRDEGGLKESVVVDSGMQGDLSPALASLGKGEYWLKIGSLDSVMASRTPVKVQWDPSAPKPVVFLGPPGLYKVEVTGPDGQPTGSDAWVLAKSEADLPRAKAAFERTLSDLTPLKEDVPDSALRAIQRAELELLSH